MKKLLLLITLFLTQKSLFSQGSCIGLFATTQAHINTFAANNPGCHVITGGIYIEGTAISSLAGLAQIDTIWGNLEFKNTKLATLQGLQNLRFLGGTLRLSGITAADFSFAGLSKLNFIGGDLEIGFDNPVASFVGLGKLDSIGGDLLFRNCKSVKTCAGLENLKTIGRDFFNGGSEIESFAGLEKLRSVGRHFDVSFSKNIKTLAGLGGLERVGGNFWVSENAVLTSFSGISNLKSIGERLVISFNPLLENLNFGFPKRVGLDVWIQNNQKLTALSGLDSLQKIGTDLWIYSNNALSSLAALSKLDSIGGKLTINLTKLTSLAPLKNLNPATISALEIGSNWVLSDCSAASICQFLEAGGAANVAGNAVGCQTTSQILAGCQPNSTESILVEKAIFEVSPNPILENAAFQITLENDFCGLFRVEIWTLDGRLFSVFSTEKTAQKQVFEIEKRLPSGAFFVRVLDKKGVRQRLVSRF
jgi:hypothetical protein